MAIAIWIIAICEIIRAAQNMLQIATLKHQLTQFFIDTYEHDTGARDNACGVCEKP